MIPDTSAYNAFKFVKANNAKGYYIKPADGFYMVHNVANNWWIELKSYVEDKSIWTINPVVADSGRVQFKRADGNFIKHQLDNNGIWSDYGSASGDGNNNIDFTLYKVTDTVKAPVDSVVISSPLTVISLNRAQTYTAVVYPETLLERGVTWSVKELTGKATITASGGVLTGTQVGTVRVFAASISDDAVKDSIDVLVKDILVESITISGVEPDSMDVKKGMFRYFTATVLPANASDPSINWEISDTIATINGGKVTPKNFGTKNAPIYYNGTVVIKVTAIDASGIVVTRTVKMYNGKDRTAIETTNITNNSLVELYPNPSKGVVTLRAANNEDVSVNVYDLTGRVIKNLRFNGSCTLDLTNNGSGMYIIDAKSGNSKQQISKLIVR
jgi:hypothetical protein